MPDTSIEIRGLRELNNKLRRMDESLNDELTRTLRDAGKLVEVEAKRYPGQTHKTMHFVSERQRRYVMMLVRQGKVPYRRTHQLETSINTVVKSVGGDMVASVGTNAVHAPWVIGHKSVGSAGPQARYHKGNWQTLRQDLAEKRDEIKALFKRMVQRWLRQ